MSARATLLRLGADMDPTPVCHVWLSVVVHMCGACCMYTQNEEESAAVQQNCMAALACLARHPKQQDKIALTPGGLTALVDGMWAHQGDAAVQLAGMTVLNNVGQEINNQAIICKTAGAVSTIVAGMEANMGAEVQEMGVTVLCQLGVTQAEAITATKGAVAAILAALSAHPRAKNVQYYGERVLGWLANEPGTC